jgi:hypothetical protein
LPIYQAEDYLQAERAAEQLALQIYPELSKTQVE